MATDEKQEEKQPDGVDLAGNSFADHHREIAVHQISALTDSSPVAQVKKAIEDAQRANCDEKEIETLLLARGFTREKLQRLARLASKAEEEA